MALRAGTQSAPARQEGGGDQRAERHESEIAFDAPVFGFPLLAAVGLSRFIAGFLVGVPALDPVTFLAVGLLLAGVAVAAAWVPAWRAAGVSPVEALGAE